MYNVAACWAKKREVVLVVVLEVLVVFHTTTRLLLHFNNSRHAAPRKSDQPQPSSEPLHYSVLLSTPKDGSSGRDLPHALDDQRRPPSLHEGRSTPPNLSSSSSSSSLPSTLFTPFVDDVQSLVEMVPPRAFPLWNNLTLPLPCPPAEAGWTSPRVQQTAARTGILYVKIAKTGSSTGSSVNLRLASRIYQRFAAASSSFGNRTSSSVSPSALDGRRVCKNRFKHAKAYSMRYGRRKRTESVLWSVVRDPTDRVVSEYFHFYVSRGGRNASDESVFLAFLWENRERLPSFEVQYLAFQQLASKANYTLEDWDEEHRALDGSAWAAEPELRPSLLPPSPPPQPAVSLETIRSIFRGYDFVGVSERMDESLVALQLLLGLETPDILYMSSKVSGGYDDGKYQSRCVYIQPSFRTPAMQQFFAGPVWRRWSMWDVVLHRAANRSLDLTIQSLGPARFRDALEAFRSLQRQVHEACSRQVRFPCDASRRDRGPRLRTDCILGDSGCGFDCLDRHLTERTAADIG